MFYYISILACNPLILVLQIAINIWITILKEANGIIPYKNQDGYSKEASLLLYQLPSVQEILPILSVIPEVSLCVSISYIGVYILAHAHMCICNYWCLQTHTWICRCTHPPKNAPVSLFDNGLCACARAHILILNWFVL